MRGIISYNPAAGRFPSRMLVERTAQILVKDGWAIDIVDVQSGKHITELARDATAAKVDAFFVAGGDGSISYAVAGLVGGDTALGVLPTGTANVWAQELDMPGLAFTRWSALQESAKLQGRPTIRSVDVGLCCDRYFLLWSGIGLDAFIVNRIEPRRRMQKYFAFLAYATTAVWQAAKWRGVTLNLLADQQSIDGHYLLALVSNIQLYAGGIIQLSRDSRSDDGCMDLWLFEGDTFGETLQIAWDLLSGRHHYSESIHRVPFKHLEITSSSVLYLQVDGEPMQVDGPVMIDVNPQAMKILVPSVTDRELFGDSDELL